jgi:hypothetical protein
MNYRYYLMQPYLVLKYIKIYLYITKKLPLKKGQFLKIRKKGKTNIPN